MPTTTLTNLRTMLYSILKEEEDSSAYPYVLVDPLLNYAQKSICRGTVSDLRPTNIREKDQLRKGPLPFLFSDKYYTSVQDTYVADDDLSVGITTIPVSTTSGYASAGFLWLNEDIAEYTGKTDTTFTGVTGIDFAHKAGTRISQLFELPTDYATSVRVIYNSTTPITNKDYRDIFLDNNDNKGHYGFSNSVSTNQNTNLGDRRPFYTIINGTYFLPFGIDNSGYMFHMIYEKIPTTMTAGSDTATIPDSDSIITIPFLAVGDLLFHRGEEDRGIKDNGFAISKIMEMYDFFSDQNNEDLRGQRVATGKDQIYNI